MTMAKSLAGKHQVDLVAAARPVLDEPQALVGSIVGHALRVAMAIAPDLGQRPLAIEKGIVLRDAAVTGQAHDGAGMIAEILRVGTLAAIADAEVDITLLVENDPAAEVAACSGSGFCLQQVLPFDECVALEFCACQHGDALVVPVTHEGEIDPVAGCEIRWHGDIEHAGLALRIDGRRSSQGGEAFAAGIKQVDFATALRDEQLVIREKGHAPGNTQAVDDLFQNEGGLLALDALGRLCKHCHWQQGEQAEAENINRGQSKNPR